MNDHPKEQFDLVFDPLFFIFVLIIPEENLLIEFFGLLKAEFLYFEGLDEIVLMILPHIILIQRFINLIEISDKISQSLLYLNHN